MPQVVLPTESSSTGGWTTIWLEFPIRILLETKRMNVAAWGGRIDFFRVWPWPGRGRVAVAVWPWPGEVVG